MTRSRSNSQARRRAFSLVTAFLLAGLLAGAGATAASAAPADDASITEASITEGSLTWGFKESFRRYIGGVPAIRVSEGAVIDSAGVGTFPLSSGSFDDATGATDLSFTGSIQYRSHCEAGLGLPAGECALDSTYSDFRLVIGPTEQSLYAHVVARHFVDGQYPMNDFGTLRIATLTAGIENFTASGGTSTWTDISTAAAREGTPATAYGSGTPLDPVSATYTGAGGLPVTGENWTAPGTVQLGATARWAADVPQNQPTSVYSDPNALVVHVVNQRTSHDLNAPALTAFDPSSLTRVGASSDLLAADWDDTGAYDPSTGTIFLSQPTTDGTLSVIAATWDAAAAAYRHEVLDETVNSLGAFTFDSVRSRLVALTVSEDYTTPLLTTWTRVGESWERTDSALPVVDERAEQLSYYSPAGATSSLAALSDGTFILTRSYVVSTDYDFLDGNPAPLAITATDESVSVAEIPGAVTTSGPDAQTGEAGYVYAGPNGSFALTPNGGAWGAAFIRLGHHDGATTTVDPERIVLPTGTGDAVVAAFDPNGRTVWAKAVTSGTIAGIHDSTIFTSHVDQDTARSYTLAALPGDAIATGGRNAEQHSTLTRIETVAVSPTITQQPTMAIVNPGATATFTAAASATPTPTVQWQQSLDGVTYSEIPDATATELSVDVSAADLGARYRAVFSNPAGALPTAAATITLATLPEILIAPTSKTVAEGEDVTFEVMSSGNPEPAVIWEQKTGTGWGPIVAGNVTLGDGTLTLTNTSRDQDGITLRAVLSNTAGRIPSEPVTLTVTFETTPVPSPTPSTPGAEGVPSESHLTTDYAGGITAPATAEQGETITVTVGVAHAGQGVNVYLFSTPHHLGGRAVTAAGTIQVTIPATATIGEHRIAVYGADGVLIGWDDITIKPSSAGAGVGDLASTGSSVIGPLAGLLILIIAGGLLVRTSRPHGIRGTAA